ncbi:MAG TPA: class I SAM-dependent methyltransferase [Steroidobacteraceae bacterium]|nr:class I SAM-dependent methyltransferase [Steroidobacteraceae bacterium]
MATALLTYEGMNAALKSQLETLPPPLRILEAGCGRHWGLDLSIPYSLTGIDLDRDALAARTDLDQAIVGDLTKAEFPPGSFDVIYCAFVLEHVKGAEQVLERFLRWLAPGGLLVIKVPDRDSAYGFLARVTPFWVHVLTYRWLLGYPEAATPGHGPYPTEYDAVISERGLARFCAAHGLGEPQVGRLCSYAGRRLVTAGAFLIHALSAGRLAWRHNNLLLVARARRVDKSGASLTAAAPSGVTA